MTEKKHFGHMVKDPLLQGSPGKDVVLLFLALLRSQLRTGISRQSKRFVDAFHVIRQIQ